MSHMMSRLVRFAHLLLQGVTSLDIVPKSSDMCPIASFWSYL